MKTTSKTTSRTSAKKVPASTFSSAPYLNQYGDFCVGIWHKLAHVEIAYILEVIRKNDGNKTKAADVLGITVRGLRGKLRRAGL